MAVRDSVVVLSQEELRIELSVDIDGWVKNPGTYMLAEGMTVQDLVLAAGGFIHGADVREAEVSRQPSDLERTETTAFVVRVPIGSTEPGGASTHQGEGSFSYARPEPRAPPRLVPTWAPSADEFELQHGDRVVIRRAPGYEEPRIVRVTGEVVRPGSYVLERRQERLTEIIRRAGGFTDEAYVPGLKLVREGHLVGTDVERALARPQSAVNVALEAGDSIHVPVYDPTVLVTGAVVFQSRVLYQEGESLLGYIRRSGGFADNADTRRVSIVYPNGERETIRRTLGFTRQPQVRPGSRIFVPVKPEGGGTDWDRVLTRTLAVMSTLATVLIAVDRISN
jgi:polysaccharide biosynthesis/export protein